MNEASILKTVTATGSLISMCSIKRLRSMILTLVHFFFLNCFWHAERTCEASDTRTFSSAEAGITSRQSAVLDHNCTRILSVRHLKPNSHLGRFVFPLSGCGGANHRQSNEDGNRKLSYRRHLCSSGPSRPPALSTGGAAASQVFHFIFNVYTHSAVCVRVCVCVCMCVCVHLCIFTYFQVWRFSGK